MISELTIIKTIKYGIYVILFIPLITIPGLFFPFVTSKHFLFQIIVEAVFALYAVLAFYRPQFRPKQTLLFWALALYFIALLFSTILSADVYRSFFGNYERMWGYFQLSHFFLFFVVLVGMFRTKEEWTKLVNTALSAGALVALSGLLQFLWFVFSGGAVKRTSGMIGNPAFLAAYLFFIFLFSLAQFFQREKSYPQYRYLALAALSLFVMLSTGTRGMFVALAAIAVVAAFAGVQGLSLGGNPLRQQGLSLGGNPPKVSPCTPTAKGSSLTRKYQFTRIISALFLLLVIISAGAIFKYGSLFEKPEQVSQEEFYTLEYIDKPEEEKDSTFSFLKRLVDFSLYDATTQTRLITWRSTPASLKESPVFGIGPANFSLAFNKHFNPEFYTYEKREVWFDRAHNIFVDALVMYGIVGFFAYLFIFITASYTLFFLYKKRHMPFSLFLAFLLFIIAYLAQNFFLFDSFSAFLVFIFALAYLNNFQLCQGETLTHSNSKGLKRLPVVFPLLVVLAVMYPFNIKPLLANHALSRMESAKSDIDTSAVWYEKALSYNTLGDNEIRSHFSLAVAQHIQKQKSQEALPDSLVRYINSGISALMQNIEQSDNRHLLYRLQLADLYNIWLSRGGEVSEEIEDMIRTSQKVSAGRIEFDLALAQAKFLRNDLDGAVALLSFAQLKNKKHPLPAWKISQMYVATEKQEEAIKYLERALYLGQRVNNPSELLWAEQYYVGKEDYLKIVFIDKILLDLYEGNVKEMIRIHQNLALAYANLGKPEKAKQHALAVAELDPSQKPLVDNFLNQL